MQGSISPDAVLDFWFGNATSDPDAIPGRMGLWFGSDRKKDAQIRTGFSQIWSEATSGELFQWAAVPRERLALIILLDQFSRNLFRGQPDAFAQDGQALELCLSGLEAGMQERLAPIEQVFFLMPLQHAENGELQAVSVKRFDALAVQVPDGLHKTFRGFAEYARLHRDIVARFGRFPHRNAILGRRNTAEEDAYLAEGGPRFGQGSAGEDPD